jgi:hypothetical protein
VVVVQSKWLDALRGTHMWPRGGWVGEGLGMCGVSLGSKVVYQQGRQ